MSLNHHPFLKGLTKPSYSLSNYKSLLLSYSLIYRLIEDVIDRFLLSHQVDFDYSERKKLPLLIKDIDYFHDDSLKFYSSPTSTSMLPDIKNTSELVGLLYVIEGSTLGGQQISRALSEFHGMTAENGACFFNGYGEQTLFRWELFLKFFDSIIQNQDDYQNAKDMACRVFQTFQLALDYCMPSYSES